MEQQKFEDNFRVYYLLVVMRKFTKMWMDPEHITVALFWQRRGCLTLSIQFLSNRQDRN